MRVPRYFVSLAAISLFLTAVTFARTRQRRHFQPNWAEGATVRYRIATSTSSNEHNVTPVVNPEATTEYKESTDLVLRFDVLHVQPAATSSGRASNQIVRFRATFEQASSDSQANAYAPSAAALDEAIAKLKGKSFEFSIDAGDRLKDVKGLGEIAPDRDVAARIVSWVHVLFAPIDLPSDGIFVGQQWSDQHELAGLPLTHVIWRNNSAYVRNEPCAAASGVRDIPGLGSGAECAVLLTRFSVGRHGSDSDATPESYLRNGLRTSGTWSGSGESLDAISLTTGLLVSATQTATQDMDYEIRSAASGSSVRHVGHTTTRTEITLLPAPAD